MSVILYCVGKPGFKPWMMTGQKAVAERFAEEMDGVVTVKELPGPRRRFHDER